MKKAFCFVLVFALSAFLCACAAGGESTTAASAQTTTAAEKAQTVGTPCSKDGVDAFIAVLKEKQKQGSIEDFPFSGDLCYNVTPDSLKEETGGAIFKFGDSGQTLLLLGGSVYGLGSYFGGDGLTSAVTCDFDGDGKKDILYTYSWGSGIHRSHLAVFNTRTKESAELYNTLDKNDLSKSGMDIIVSKLPGTSSDAGTPFDYIVYSAEITVQDNNFASLQYTQPGVFGSVKAVDGVPVFVKAQP